MNTETSQAKPENSPQLVQFGEPLPLAVQEFLRTTNPWWQGEPMAKPPPFRRWMFEPTLQRFKKGMTPAVVLRGTRQVGKTTLQQQIIHHLLHEEGVAPNRILRVQFEQVPELENLQWAALAISHWFERNVLGETFNTWGNRKQPAYLLFDEAQIVPYWDAQLKILVDHHTVRVLLTGSSAFRIEKGRDSLAGRITTIDVNTLKLREIAALRGWGELPPLLPFNGWGELKEQEFWEELREHGKRHKKVRDKAFAAFSERGGYPVPQLHHELSWKDASDYLEKTIIRRVIEHDLGPNRNRSFTALRTSLLEALFQLTCRYAGQSPGKPVLLGELQQALLSNTNWEEVNTHLRLLNDSLLIRLVRPLELRLKRQKGNPDKICLADHSLRASLLQEQVPLTPAGLQKAPHLAHLAGFLAENIAGYYLSVIAQSLAWFPARKTQPEVDFILTLGQYRVPMEVKYRHTIKERDTKNLRAFLDNPIFNAPFGILLTLTDNVKVKDKRIVALPLSSLLLMR